MTKRGSRSPAVQSGDLVRHRALGGKDQHPQFGVLFPNPAQHLQPVQLGQVQIQNHQVVFIDTVKFQSLLTVIDAVHSVTPLAQPLGHRRGQRHFHPGHDRQRLFRGCGTQQRMLYEWLSQQAHQFGLHRSLWLMSIN